MDLTENLSFTEGNSGANGRRLPALGGRENALGVAPKVVCGRASIIHDNSLFG